MVYANSPPYIIRTNRVSLLAVWKSMKPTPMRKETRISTPTGAWIKFARYCLCISFGRRWMTYCTFFILATDRHRDWKWASSKEWKDSIENPAQGRIFASIRRVAESGHMVNSFNSTFLSKYKPVRRYLKRDRSSWLSLLLQSFKSTLRTRPNCSSRWSNGDKAFSISPRRV